VYALAVIRYRRPIEEVLVQNPAHRAYLQALKDSGILVASGPLDPRHGGALLLRVPDDNAQSALDAVRDHDPYWISGVAQYELLAWNVTTGKEELDKL
jgi:uncharacterized protein YciI